MIDQQHWNPIVRSSALLLPMMLAAGTALGAEPAAPARPNVLIVVGDDMGYGDFSFNGHPILKTPNIDRLAAQSARFTDFHVAPMCSPTRSMLYTGRHCLVNGASAVCGGRHLLRADLPTMADLYRDAGYATGLFGKWHLGEPHPYRPGDRGFDEVLSFPGSCFGGIGDFWENDGFDDVVLLNNVRTRLQGFTPDAWADRAMAWMEQKAQAHTPFLCLIPTTFIHGPEFIAGEEKEPFAKHGPTMARLYASQTHFDGQMGRLMDFLAQRHLERDTILVFLSDNGPHEVMAKVWNAGMRGAKKSLYDGGHRVPCLIRWNGGGIMPRDIAGLTDVKDLLPTLMELCAVKPGRGFAPEGVSLAAVVRGGPDAAAIDRTLIVQYSTHHVAKGGRPETNRPECGDAAVLWKRYRLVQGRELYDLDRDPGQTTNRITELPEVARIMQDAYGRWWEVNHPDHLPLCEIPLGMTPGQRVELSPSEWPDTWIDHASSVRQAQNTIGAWHLRVDVAGRYAFAIRRWPEESHLPMTAPCPASHWPYEKPGVAMPIAAVRLRIAGQDLRLPVSTGDLMVATTVALPAGSTTCEAAFLNAAGTVLSGAYYVAVTGPESGP